MGESLKLICEGLESGKVHQPVLSPEALAQLVIAPDKPAFDGDPATFKLGIEAMRLGLAYEYDPYFSLSIARVDPLPHQLEAVYDYFLRRPSGRNRRALVGIVSPPVGRGDRRGVGWDRPIHPTLTLPSDTEERGS